MSRNKLLVTVGLAVVVITMMTSNTISVYSTVEDDGWVEGDDDSQGEISNQEELEEAYEGSQWEDDIGPNEFEEATNSGGGGGDDTPVIANTPALTKQNTAVNETRWYNDCIGEGKQDGGGLQFNTFSYQTCG
ncbi:MAG: hypothetical protein ACRD8Z_13080, partial [Nitrososphaeraceae archaeon]